MNFKRITNRKAKRYMTLLEVLIAMLLLAMLLGVVFGFFRELSLLNEKTKATVKESFQRRYVESWLSTIFSRLVNENKAKRPFYFFITKDEASPFPSLILTFNNGYIFDGDFGGDVLGRLFVDKEKRLCLAIWPLEMGNNRKGEDMRLYLKTEYLLENVEELHFYCLSPPETKNDVMPEKDQDAVPHRGEWLIDEWDKEYKQMPVIVKMELTLKGNEKKETFAFVLPSSKHPITFIPRK